MIKSPNRGGSAHRCFRSRKNVHDQRPGTRSEPVNGPRRDIGIVFQDPVLLPWRTVLDNVMLPIEVLRLDRAAYRKRAMELIHLVGLDGFDDTIRAAKEWK